MILIIFLIDASDNLTFNDFWKKDVSNNLYYTSGKIGIGVTKPKYDLDVLTPKEFGVL